MTATASKAAPAMEIDFGKRKHTSKGRAYQRFSALTTRGSCVERTVRAVGKVIAHKAGVRVRATSKDAPSAMLNAKPSGCSNRPSTPSRKKMGVNTSTMMSVAITMEGRTSMLAWYTVVSNDGR